MRAKLDVGVGGRRAVNAFRQSDGGEDNAPEAGASKSWVRIGM